MCGGVLPPGPGAALCRCLRVWLVLLMCSALQSGSWDGSRHVPGLRVWGGGEEPVGLPCLVALGARKPFGELTVRCPPRLGCGNAGLHCPGAPARWAPGETSCRRGGGRVGSDLASTHLIWGQDHGAGLLQLPALPLGVGWDGPALWGSCGALLVPAATWVWCPPHTANLCCLHVVAVRPPPSLAPLSPGRPSVGSRIWT